MALSSSGRLHDAALDRQGRAQQCAGFRVEEMEGVGRKLHADGAAVLQNVLTLPARCKGVRADREDHLRLIAHHFRAAQRDGGSRAAAWCGELDLLGADADLPVAAFGQVALFGCGQRYGERMVEHKRVAVQRRLGEVHLRRADEAGHEGVCRRVVQLERRAGLLYLAVVQHHDAVAHRHGFHLVVCDVDDGQAELALDAADLRAHVAAELGIEVRERFVHQADRRVAAHAAGERHSLALTAGEFARLAVQVFGEAEHLSGFSEALLLLCLRNLAHVEAEEDVVAHGHVRVKRVVLENHGEVAVFRRHFVGDLAVKHQRAGGNLLETGDDAQQRTFTAARRADEDEELALAHVEADAFQNVLFAVVRLDDVADFNFIHSSFLPSFIPRLQPSAVRRKSA